MDHGILRHDLFLAEEAIVDGRRMSEARDRAIAKRIVPIHRKQGRRVGDTQFLIDGAQDVEHGRWCRKTRQDARLEAQGTIVTLCWVLTETNGGHGRASSKSEFDRSFTLPLY